MVAHLTRNINGTLRELDTHFFVPSLTDSQRMDDLYSRLRDDPVGSDLKDKIEYLWKEYKPFASKRFLIEAQINFHQRWWEMYLTVGLLHVFMNSGINIETSNRDRGPDIRINHPDGLVVWIEAIAPDPGNGDDRIPEHEEDGVFDLPKDECLLRLAQGLTVKKEKFKKYENNKVVNQQDPCIIALSSCGLHQFGHFLDFPCTALLGVLSGAHNMVLSESKPPFVSKRQGIVKASGNSVPVCLLDDPSFDAISAFIYSSEDPLNAPLDAESTFKIFLNPNARNPLPKCFLTNIKIETWNCEKNDNGMTWKKI
jgi:hypothetical protein